MDNLNIYNIVILLGLLHGIIFGLIILINQKLRSKTNFYLAITVFSLAFSNLQYWLKDVNLYPNLKYLPFFPFEFLMLPFFYFFVKSYLSKRISLKEVMVLLFFFPFFIIYQYIFNEKYFSVNLVEYINLFIEHISIVYSVVLIVIIYRVILNYEKSNFNNINVNTKWLKRVLTIGLILCLIWFLSFNIIDLSLTKGYYRFYPLWIGISFLIYWIGYASIFESNILKERKVIRNSNMVLKHKPISKVQSKTFNDIENKILNERLFLDPDLKLKTIAVKLNLSEGYLSQLFKKYAQQTFNDYINSLRVNEAKRMLLDEEFKRYTITAIGLESGFNSKSSFYSVFKKHTSKTPNAYKKEVQNA
ncbi:MAG: helix-turn-helix domain-containing protein [Winogradskyella sp.]|uniref:helix-turn-helix domain-containing protein n=1 Tax=Winogradskyella sp. TaxID=1883156 RepID=UPI00385FDE6A